jgi:crotonobetaine/carnitine-CoA ligase
VTRRLSLDERVAGSLLLDRAATHGDDPFVSVGDGAPLTFAEVAQQAVQAAGGFRDLGVRKGTPVALMLENRLEYIVAWLGLSLLGAVEVPINTALKGPLLQHILSDSRSELVVVEAALAEEVRRVAGALPFVHGIVIVAGEAQANETEWAEVAAGDRVDLPDVSAADPIAIMYTSGTTGAAKGVLCPHGYFMCWADDTTAAVRLERGDVLYTPLPLYHITAQAVNVLGALVVGCRVHVDVRFSLTRFWQRMADLGSTHVWSFGSMTPLLFRAEDDAADRAHRVRVVWSIPWPAGYGHEFERRFGVKLMNGYGSTEQGLTIVQPYDAPRPDTIGTATEHYDVEVVGSDGRVLGAGEVGEIVTRPREPASMMLGYLERPADTLEAIRDLWYHTGDRGIRDEDGYFSFVDRTKDAIRRRGENISAWEVESVIARHPAIDECAAVAVPSELGEDDVKLVATTCAPIAERELFDYCVSELPYYMVPRYIELVDSFPKTPSLRIQKFVLRDQGVTGTTWDCEAEGIRIRRPQVQR